MLPEGKQRAFEFRVWQFNWETVLENIRYYRSAQLLWDDRGRYRQRSVSKLFGSGIYHR